MKSLVDFGRLIIALALCLAFETPVAHAQDQTGRDRVVFGDDVRIGRGERVNDLVSIGGDVVVEGEVLGDVVVVGGDLVLESASRVNGDAVTVGGSTRVERGAAVRGDRVSLGGLAAVGGGAAAGVLGAGALSLGVVGYAGQVLESVFGYAFLFILGLLLMGFAPERLSRVQATIVRAPFRSGATGALAFVGAFVAGIVLVLTIVGIPAAIVLALLAPIGAYVGLAAAATVVGATIPIERLAGRPVAQLAAGVGGLFVASLVPYLGAFVTAAAACAGVGALLLSKLGTRDVDASGVTPEGPYRTQASF